MEEASVAQIIGVKYLHEFVFCLTLYDGTLNPCKCAGSFRWYGPLPRLASSKSVRTVTSNIRLLDDRATELYCGQECEAEFRSMALWESLKGKDMVENMTAEPCSYVPASSAAAPKADSGFVELRGKSGN